MYTFLLSFSVDLSEARFLYGTGIEVSHTSPLGNKRDQNWIDYDDREIELNAMHADIATERGRHREITILPAPVIV